MDLLQAERCSFVAEENRRHLSTEKRSPESRVRLGLSHGDGGLTTYSDMDR